MTSRVREPYGSYTRAADGVIVQFVSATGARCTVVSHGIPKGRGPIGDGASAALRQAIAEMEAWPGEWWVEVISSPSTIFRDLQGTRENLSVANKRRVASMGTRDEHAHTPEVVMLGAIGRRDLLVGAA